MRKVYSKESGIYVFVDPVTREQIGGGLFDSIFSALGSTAAKQLAKETIKKSATAIGTAALYAGRKKLGEKVGEYVADKIAPTKASEHVTPTKPSEHVADKITPVAKPGALIKEIKKYADESAASKIGKILGKGKIHKRINRLL